jgi:hypothetical protein
MMTWVYPVDLRVCMGAFVKTRHACQRCVPHFRLGDSFAIKLVQHQSPSDPNLAFNPSI